MKRIKQINESKKMIFDGFMRLLEVKDFDEISISEIAKEACVTRMTIYRHFSEKEDIILFTFEQSFKKALDILARADKPTLERLLIFRFKALQDSPYTKILDKHNKLSKLFQTIGKEFVNHFYNIIPELEDKYEMSFIAGGIDTVTELWIRSGMKESPEDMASKVSEMLNLFGIRNVESNNEVL
jgi:AcrR family transcriptional regulator